MALSLLAAKHKQHMNLERRLDSAWIACQTLNDYMNLNIGDGFWFLVCPFIYIDVLLSNIFDLLVRDCRVMYGALPRQMAPAMDSLADQRLQSIFHAKMHLKTSRQVRPARTGV